MNYTKKQSPIVILYILLSFQFLFGNNDSSENTANFKLPKTKLNYLKIVPKNSFYYQLTSNWKNLEGFINWKKELSCVQTSPTAPALGFNIFTLASLKLSKNETEGSVATGGNLTIAGNYQIATNDNGTFEIDNTPIGLLVGGKVIYQSGNSLQINQSSYIKIGDNQGSTVWYKDQNNASSNIRITPNSNYNSSPRILLQTNANQLNVSSTNNPVFENNLIDFSSAFQTLETNALSLSQNTNNAKLTNPNGQPISNISLPNQVKINLQDGVNYLNVTGNDINNVRVFTYNNKPSANKVLVINVNTSDTFNWNVWNQSGIGQQEAHYIIYNFYNTKTLNIKGNSTIEGTIFAPFADITKSVNQSNIQGQVIGKSFFHSGGEVHSANFTPAITSCSNSNGVAPTSEFTMTNGEQCLETNKFIFNNTSNTGDTSQPEAPITYTWNFGDGTTSSLMNPTKTYTSSGVFSVSLVATNTFGSDTETKQLTIKNTINTPVIDEITLSSPSGSVSKEFTLNNDTYYDSFYWELINVGSNLYPNQKVVTFDFTAEGSYELEVTGIKNGCSQSLKYFVIITSDEVSTGNNGGTESESLGDAISKIYVKRKKNSEPTIFVKSKKNIYNKSELIKNQIYRGKGQTMLDMFPTELVEGNESNITSPTDILDYTVADEVLSVDFSVNGKTKGVVLGIKTTDKIYNHTKASCDRLRGAEILNIQTVKLDGYNFLMQGIKQRNGAIEYAISFVAAKNTSDNNYTIQTNWYVNEYIKFNDAYNFQVWSTNPSDTKKLLKDILDNLNGYLPVNQTEILKIPKTFATKISRVNSNLIIDFKSVKEGLNTEISMIEIYSETTDKSEYRYNPINTKLKQTLTIDIKDGYEYEGLIKVGDEIQDAFYHADGNWGLDFDNRYTEVQEYIVSNNFDREYNDDEYAINRNVKIKAVSEYDYLGIYKSLLPGNLSADYSAYKYLSFTAKGGGGLIELGLIKSSVEEWKEQYRVMINLSEEEQTYYIPFENFTSIGSSNKINADDLTTVLFTFLPVEAKTNDLDLFISNVKFTKTAALDVTTATINEFDNKLITYPNPTLGNVNIILFSKTNTKATVSLFDITGKEIYTSSTNLTKGKNEIEINAKVNPGILFLKVRSNEINYGTTKIIFR
jgi:choice-of-anchor A domain-containing protein